jgi:hypothetical protein
MLPFILRLYWRIAIMLYLLLVVACLATLCYASTITEIHHLPL